MTINELDNILALKDWNKISAEIEKHGFRQAGEVGEWEFKPKILCEESAYCESASQTDVTAGKMYRGTLYRDNKTYEGFTFITLTLWLTLRDKNNVSIPKRSLLFTDAPYNAAYIREINSPYPCDRCGKVYIKKKLCEEDDKFLCDKCFVKTIEEEFRIHLSEELSEKIYK